MDKQKQIEEMSNLIYDNRPIKDIWNEEAEDIAKTLYNAGYRKIPENAVVVPDMAGKDFYAVEKAEWDKMVKGAKDIIQEREEQARKETAEKFAYKVNTAINNHRKKVGEDDYVVNAKRLIFEVNEICEEFTEGKE